MDMEITASEYLKSFAGAVLLGLCEDNNSRECIDALGNLERDIADMPFIKKFGNMEFSFQREPEEYAKHVLEGGEYKIEIPIELSESVAKMMATLLVDSWGKTLLNM